MKLKQLESALCSVPNIEFDTPNITLEQYPTSPQLTAQIIHVATEQYQDIGPNRTVIDLGCGTAMLSIGCALVDTDHIIAIDCDTNALTQAQENVNDMEMNDRISFLQAKVPFSNFSMSRYQAHSQRNSNSHHRHKNSRHVGGRSQSNPQQRKPPSNSALTARNVTATIDTVQGDVESTSISNNRPRFPLHDKCVDTVMTNPPFGTKGDHAGIDIEFVLLACQLARRAVYSFHKTTTRDYVLRTIQTNVSNIKSVNVIAEMKFDISNTYRFHQQKSVDIAVDLIRVELLHP